MQFFEHPVPCHWLSIAAGAPSKRLVALEDMPPEINKNTVTQSNFPRFLQLGFKLLF